MKQNETSTVFSVIIILEEKLKETITGFSKYVEILYHFFEERKESFEFLIVANGCESNLKEELDKIGLCRHLKLRAFALTKKVSHAVCLQAALRESKGRFIFACGPYQQLTVDSLHELVTTFKNGDVDIVVPWRQERRDPAFSRFQSKIFNTIVRSATGSQFHDLSCNVKIFRREILEDIRLYGNMYTYLPIVAEHKGFRCVEVKCTNFMAMGRTGLYSFAEYLSRFIDILTIYFNTRFSKKPLRFFSSVGAIFILISLLLIFHVATMRVVTGEGIGNSPELIISMILMVFGVQATSVGLLGEIVVFTQGRHIKEYTIREVIIDGYKGVERRKTAKKFCGYGRRKEEDTSISIEGEVSRGSPNC